MKNIFLFFLCFVLSACQVPDLSLNTQLSSQKLLDSPKSPALPEPMIIHPGQPKKSTPFKQFTARKQALSLKHIIHFPNLDSKLKQFSDIQLDIQTSCYLNNQPQKTITKSMIKPLEPFIHLISLLPEEVLRPNAAKTPPVCRVYFTAAKTSRPMEPFHIFWIPWTPLQQPQTSHLIQITSPQDRNDPAFTAQKITSEFPYILRKNASSVWVDVRPFIHSNFKGPGFNVDFLKLHCGPFEWSYKAPPSQTMPFSAFFTIPARSSSLHKTSLHKNEREFSQMHPIQSCRILGYHKNQIAGVSLVFNLVHSPQKPHITRLPFLNDPEAYYRLKPAAHFAYYNNQMAHLPTSAPLLKEMTAFHQLWLSMQLKKPHPLPFYDEKPPLYFYLISNPHPYPVHLLIEGQNAKTQVFGLFYENKAVFYDYAQKPADLTIIEGEPGVVKKTQIEQSTLVTLKPQGFLYLQVSSSPLFTHQALKPSVWELGFIFEPLDIKIHQLISGETAQLPFRENVLSPINVKNAPMMFVQGPIAKMALTKLYTLSFNPGRTAAPISLSRVPGAHFTTLHITKHHYYLGQSANTHQTRNTIENIIHPSLAPPAPAPPKPPLSQTKAKTCSSPPRSFVSMTPCRPY